MLRDDTDSSVGPRRGKFGTNSSNRVRHLPDDGLPVQRDVNPGGEPISRFVSDVPPRSLFPKYSRERRTATSPGVLEECKQFPRGEFQTDAIFNCCVGRNDLSVVR